MINYNLNHVIIKKGKHKMNTRQKGDLKSKKCQLKENFEASQNVKTGQIIKELPQKF